eukprot:364974-Chlamydomonas_euryale.AAC.6
MQRTSAQRPGAMSMRCTSDSAIMPRPRHARVISAPWPRLSDAQVNSALVPCPCNAQACTATCTRTL